MGESQDSQFMKYCRSMDEAAITSEEFGDGYYLNQIKHIRQNKGDYYYTDLFFQEAEYQAKYEGHIIASVHGGTGSMKSLFSIYCLDRLGDIFNVPFDMEKNLYINLTDLDNGLREAPPRSSHLKDEQKREYQGVGSWAEQMSLRDYENTQRKQQKNIFFVSPDLRDHQHRFVFSSFDDNIKRITNELYCEHCPDENYKKCMAYANSKIPGQKFLTFCPPEFELLRGEAVPFWERSGYPAYCEFLLKTPKNFSNSNFPELVPRGILRIPFPRPDLVVQYERIKDSNIIKLEQHQDSSYEYLNILIKKFVETTTPDKLIRLKGNIYEKAFRAGGEIKLITMDSRYYAPEAKGVIQTYFFEFNKSNRRYTSGQMKIVTDMIIKLLNDYCDLRNKELKAEKDKKRIAEQESLKKESV